MRNLKKILALVLALMMVLSVMVTSSAAFEDAAEIQHSEAVEVMSNLGILLGDGTNFNPNGTLTRAQAAVIIAKVMEGSVDNISALVDAVDNPFKDVPAWALDYVLYCYSKGVVRGTSADKYTPNKNLTGYEFGKMLLVATGICKDADFNNNWKMVVAEKLAKAELLGGLSDLVLSKDLSREHAAQLAFNAMQYATTSNYGYAVYTVEGEKSVVLGYYPTMIEAATAAKVLGDGYFFNTKPTSLPNDSLASANFGLNKVGTDNPMVGLQGIGFEGYFWYVEGDGEEGYSHYVKDVVVSSFICTDKFIGTFTKANTNADITAALGKKYDKVDTYLNGYPQATGVDFKNDDKVNPVVTDTDMNVTVVVRADKSVDFLYAQEFLTFAKNLGKFPTTDKTHPYYGKYVWAFNYAGTETAATYVYGAANAYTDGAAYMVINTAIPTIYAPKAVVGTIDGVATDKYIRVNGEVKYLSDAATDDNVKLSTDVNDKYTVYLNSVGHVIYVGGVNYTPTAPSYDGHAYLLALEYVATPYSSTGLMVGTGADATITAKATIVTVDGEKLVVDVATAILENDEGGYDCYFGLNGGMLAIDDREPHSVIGTKEGQIAPDWFAYTVEDGVYSFAAKAAKPASGYTDKGAEIVVNGTTYYMTATTELVFYTFNTVTKGIDLFTRTGYVGYSGKNYINGVDAIVVADPVTKVATSITFFDVATPEEDADYAVYAGKLEDSNKGDDYDVYGFYVNGELNTYRVAAGTRQYLPANKGVVVGIRINAQGQVTYCKAVNYNLYNNMAITAVSADGTYVIADNLATEDVKEATVIYINDRGCVVYDAVYGYAVAELAVGQIINVQGNSYGAQFILVTDYVVAE